jgi:hypothetical protein
MVAAFFFAKLMLWNRQREFRSRFKHLDGKYEENIRINEKTVMTGGTVVLKYTTLNRFKLSAITADNVELWRGELVMREDAAVVGGGYYTYAGKDDTGVFGLVPKIETTS